MLASERQLLILRKLDQYGIVHLQTLCKEFKSSESTIRRDFEELESQNKLKRVHGGAVKIKISKTLSDAVDIGMDARSQMNVEEKKALCKYIADQIDENDCVFIDGGSTFMFLPMFLEGKKVTIVTHSDFIRTKEDTTLSILVIGGKYIPTYRMNVGPIAMNHMNLFNFDKAFIGCAGLEGKTNDVYTAETETAQIKELAMKKATDSYLVFDSSKINVKGFYKFSNAKDFKNVIVNKGIKLNKLDNVIYI